MERLLRRDGDRIERICHYGHKDKMCYGCIDRTKCNADIFASLAAYEDTDLPPEICREYKTFEDEIVSKGVTVKRIVELMNAEAEGRLVVLPCQKGERLFINGREFEAHHWNITLTAFRDEPTYKSGHALTVLSVEEAAAALKEAN